MGYEIGKSVANAPQSVHDPLDLYHSTNENQLKYPLYPAKMDTSFEYRGESGETNLRCHYRQQPTTEKKEGR